MAIKVRKSRIRVKRKESTQYGLKMHTRACINLAQGSIFLVSHPKKSHALEIAEFISCSSILKAWPTGVFTSGCPPLSLVGVPSFGRPSPPQRGFSFAHLV